jgi:pyocin large subunit-like protein
MIAKVKKLSEVYGDPMGTVARMMSTVKERLAKIDSGKDTQLTEQQIVALLNDLIMIEEDKASQPPPSQQNAKTQSEKKDGEDKEGRQPGNLPNGKPPKEPITGASTSRIRNGNDPTHEEKVSGINSGKEKDWTTLPPEEVEKLREICRLRVNERYRSVIVDYHIALAKTEKNL